jgi:hypothetical protein
MSDHFDGDENRDRLDGLTEDVRLVAADVQGHPVETRARLDSIDRRFDSLLDMVEQVVSRQDETNRLLAMLVDEMAQFRHDYNDHTEHRPHNAA